MHTNPIYTHKLAVWGISLTFLHLVVASSGVSTLICLLIVLWLMCCEYLCFAKYLQALAWNPQDHALAAWRSILVRPLNSYKTSLSRPLAATPPHSPQECKYGNWCGTQMHQETNKHECDKKYLSRSWQGAPLALSLSGQRCPIYRTNIKVAHWSIIAVFGLFLCQCRLGPVIQEAEITQTSDLNLSQWHHMYNALHLLNKAGGHKSEKVIQICHWVCTKLFVQQTCTLLALSPKLESQGQTRCTKVSACFHCCQFSSAYCTILSAFYFSSLLVFHVRQLQLGPWNRSPLNFASHLELHMLAFW